MKRSHKNLGLKVATVLTALAATTGFYGLIQAHPLTHQQVATQPSNDSASAVSAPINSADGVGLSPAAPSAPFTRRPVTRTRAS